jgi:translocation and assembly module TamB
VAGGGMVSARLSSSQPLRPSLPEAGAMALEWQGIELSLLRPWLPGKADLAGRLAGRVTGLLLPAQRFVLDGDAILSEGNITWRGASGETAVILRSAHVAWGWQGETLSGTATLVFAEYGQANGTFRLPISARFPVAADPRGPLQAALVGQVREKGALAVLFPGSVQESRGDCEVNLTLGGSWDDPQMTGGLRLTKAGAYLPTAGIHLTDVELAAHFEKDAVHIDSFRALSGRGHLEGTAVIRLKRWQVIGYRGAITGERFRAVYFPELDLEISPRMTFEGTPKKLTVRGELRLPEVHVTGAPVRGGVAPSPDVIIEGRTPPAPKKFPLDLDMRVRLVLGEKVLVKLAGIDAQLGGAVELTAVRSLDHITSTGEIKVVRGRYATYGVNLEIVRGRLFYAGGPIDRPALDILALRKVGTVRAGVTVGGTLRSPVINLYSEPAMPDVDILAYIVLGRPLGGAGEQVDLLTTAAGALLSAGQSVVLQDKIKNRLGLGTLEIHAGGQNDSGQKAYEVRPFPTTGASQTTPANDISQTMLTVGKYLTPKLYVSYGRSLFSGSNRFLLRYDLHKNWQVETQTGTESGIDLYYKIEFK